MATAAIFTAPRVGTNKGMCAISSRSLLAAQRPLKQRQTAVAARAATVQLEHAGGVSTFEVADGESILEVRGATSTRKHVSTSGNPARRSERPALAPTARRLRLSTGGAGPRARSAARLQARRLHELRRQAGAHASGFVQRTPPCCRYASAPCCAAHLHAPSLPPSTPLSTRVQVSGQVDQSATMLSDEVKDKGYVLLCCAVPLGDVAVRVIEEEELLQEVMV